MASVHPLTIWVVASGAGRTTAEAAHDPGHWQLCPVPGGIGAGWSTFPPRRKMSSVSWHSTGCLEDKMNTVF